MNGYTWQPRGKSRAAVRRMRGQIHESTRDSQRIYGIRAAESTDRWPWRRGRSPPRAAWSASSLSGRSRTRCYSASLRLSLPKPGLLPALPAKPVENTGPRSLSAGAECRRDGRAQRCHHVGLTRLARGAADDAATGTKNEHRGRARDAQPTRQVEPGRGVDLDV